MYRRWGNGNPKDKTGKGKWKMKRRVMTIDEIREESTYFMQTKDYSAGICALVDVENMGFCKDGVTRWYHFEDENGNPAVFYKR